MIDVFLNLRSGSNKVVFLGQSALTVENRQKKGLPFFFRNSWVDDITCSTVIFNDPTLYLYDDLLAGWSQGSPQTFGIPAMASVCEQILATIGDGAEFGFYGSSAGGFWALMMSGYMQAPCAVETPQTNMMAYPLEKPKELLLKRCYRDHGLNPNDFLHRLSVVDWFDHLGTLPTKIQFYQSREDLGHVKSQMEPFMERMASRVPLTQTLYDRDAGKPPHGPMKKVQSLAVINGLLTAPGVKVVGT